MKQTNDTSYIDEKGRVRWHRNEEVAAKLKQLGEFLIIGGYEESHATRYAKLAYLIARYPESVVELLAENRLTDIPGIGATIAGIVAEFLTTGTCAKMEDWARHTPRTVLELTTIPGLGARTIRALYLDEGIDSLDAYHKALQEGRLKKRKGLARKPTETLQLSFV